MVKYAITWKLKAIMGAVFVINLIAVVYAAVYDVLAFPIGLISLFFVWAANMLLWGPIQPRIDP